ncbi:MAG: hypothetical protein EOO29_52990 [Comamonadaceae bacterium]|nr:MAG: hypothetical protein EOO29_52990 [Comamonadaceae bacterium]
MTPQAAAPTPASADAPAKPARALRWLAGAVAVLACLAVSGMYTAPDFMVMLADQMWACF